MKPPRWIIALDTDGSLVPAREDAMPLNARRFRTREHAERVCEKLNIDLGTARTERDFGDGARPT